jgi:hypothetical protein
VRRIIPPILLAFSLFFIYLRTLAPGLTWANDGADGGDFITAAATNGIAHPTGYPVYLLLAKLFQALPVGSLAFRTNLLSALAAVLAAVLVYGILVWLPASPVAGNWLAGLIAGYSFGISPLLWSQAVITEVYTVQAAFAALSVFLTLAPPTFLSRTWLDRLRGLVLGLAMGNHLTSIFLIPPALLAATWKDRWKFDGRSLLRLSAWIGAGLLVYLLVPIRALSNSPVKWGNPVNLRQFIWLVTGELYQRNLLDLTGAGLLERTQAWATLLLQQFALPGVVLALMGLIYFFKPSRLYFLTAWNVILFSAFAIFYASFDSYVYLIPAFLSFAIWIGLGMGGILQWLTGRFARSLQTVILGSFFCLLVILTLSRWSTVDAAHDQRAEQFGAHVMESFPPNTLVFAEDDRTSFALWYFHFALKQRPDLIVLTTGLLRYDWYVENIRATYPSLQLPDDPQWTPMIADANPTRPVCYVSYDTEEEISCEPAP